MQFCLEIHVSAKYCRIWWTITGNFGNVLPIDWSKTYARELQDNSLNINRNQVKCLYLQKLMPHKSIYLLKNHLKLAQVEEKLDLSEDEELREAFDIHSMIISTLQNEPIVTAEEVISEIDSIMQVMCYTHQKIERLTFRILPFKRSFEGKY